MKADFKQVFSVLYDQFGDEVIAWGQHQVVSYIDSKFGSDEGSSEEEFVEARSAGDDEVPPLSDTTQQDDSDYQDGEAFSAGVEQTVQGFAAEVIKSPEQVVGAVMGLVVMAGEVRKFEEVQVTKRVGIAAERDVAIAQIKMQQELLQDYLSRSFDERADNFSKLFQVVDNALETHDMTALALGLESVIQLATSSPFKDLRTVEETAAALANPDHEWDF